MARRHHPGGGAASCRQTPPRTAPPSGYPQITNVPSTALARHLLRSWATGRAHALALDVRAVAMRLRAADRHAQLGLLGPHAGKRAPADAFLPPPLCDFNAAIAQRLGLRVAGELEHPRKLRRLDALLGPALEAVVGHAVADFDLQRALRRAAARLDAARRRNREIQVRALFRLAGAGEGVLCVVSRDEEAAPLPAHRAARRAGRFRARREPCRPRFTPRRTLRDDREAHLRRRRCRPLRPLHAAF